MIANTLMRCRATGSAYAAIAISLAAGNPAVAQAQHYDQPYFGQPPVERPTYGRSHYGQARERLPESLEQRVARLERQLNNRALVDMLQRLDLLERDIQRLQGEHEVQDHRLDTLARRQKTLQAELSQRLQAAPDEQPDDGSEGVSAGVSDPGPTEGFAGDDTPASADTPAESTVAGTDAGGSQATPDPAAERPRYRHGFELLRAGDLPAAITALDAYLRDYPQGRYAADARYWVADAHYVEQHFEQSLRDFSLLVNQYPDSSKVPKALFKIGLIYTELRQPEQAKQMFLELRRRYPGSTAARLAGEKLREL